MIELSQNLSKDIEDDSLSAPGDPILGYPRPTLSYAPYSHSIVPGGFEVMS